MTVKIPLSRGFEAIIDDEDADLLEIKWTYSGRYAFRFTKSSERTGEYSSRKNISVHRVVMERMIGRMLTKDEMVDHKNRDPLDNRRENLRICTPQQNCFNRNMSSRNVTGYKGVQAVPPFKVTISVNGKRKSIGSYNTAEEAARAYDKVAKKYYGEFASLNFPDE